MYALRELCIQACVAFLGVSNGDRYTGLNKADGHAVRMSGTCLHVWWNPCSLVLGSTDRIHDGKGSESEIHVSRAGHHSPKRESGESDRNGSSWWHT